MQFIKREAVRAIILDENNEVLLMQIQNPANGKKFWICPGGGIEKKENLLDALQRELREELSLESIQSCHQVHEREHSFEWKNRLIQQKETFFIVRTNKFHPVIRDETEAEIVLEFRWWQIDDMDAPLNSITPLELKSIIQSFLAK